MKEGFLKCDENDIRNNNYRNRDGIYIKKAKSGRNVFWSNLKSRQMALLTKPTAERISTTRNRT